MTTEELLIHELAERAGVSIRTIRYYIGEGLLPEPNYQGKYSYYTLAYLDRLELIRRLKDSYLPLREIREIMNSLTDTEVRRRLKELPQSSPKLSEQTKPPQTRSKPGARALDYIDRVMDDQSKYRLKGTQDKTHSTIVKDINQWITPQINLSAQSPEKQKLTLKLPSLKPENQPAPEKQAETWQRISLAPGVELHLLKPLNPNLEKKVNQLLFAAKRLFMKDQTEE